MTRELLNIGATRTNALGRTLTCRGVKHDGDVVEVEESGCVYEIGREQWEEMD